MVATQTFVHFHPEPRGRGTHFDYSHIFQMGWFNHQIDLLLGPTAAAESCRLPSVNRRLPGKVVHARQDQRLHCWNAYARCPGVGLGWCFLTQNQRGLGWDFGVFFSGKETAAVF